MKSFFVAFLIILVFTGTTLAEKPSLKPSYALIESKEDAKSIAIGVENFLINIQKNIDFYVGASYNKDKETGYPILAIKQGKYTLEYAHQDWFDAPDNHYWKFKMKKFLGQDRLYLELSQKKQQYTVKGFVKFF